MTEIGNISSKDVLPEVVKEVVQVQNLEIIEEHICRVISKEVKDVKEDEDEVQEEEEILYSISGLFECDDKEKKLLLEKGSFQEKEEVACFEGEEKVQGKLNIPEGIASKRRFVADAIFSVVGISRNVEEGFELFTEEEKDLIFQEELSKPDDENKMLKNFPNVDENEPNYLEEIDIGEPIQFKSHEDFQEAVKDFPEIPKWSEKGLSLKKNQVRGGKTLNRLRSLIGETVEVLKSSENRLQELETIGKNNENDLTFEQQKKSNKYSNARTVLEDQKMRDEFLSETCLINEIKALQIGQHKRLYDDCVIDNDKATKTADIIFQHKTIIEQTISSQQKLLVECVGNREEAISEFEREKEISKRDIDLLKGKYLNHKIEFLEQYRKLNEMYMSLKETQTILAVSEAKHEKREILSVQTIEEMDRRICVIDDRLDDLRSAHDITEDCIRAFYETIHENGENKLERNINMTVNTYRMKEEEGKNDVKYLIGNLISYDDFIIGNIGRTEREEDRILAEEHFQSMKLSSYNGYEDYDDLEKEKYRKIQSDKSRITKDLQKYKTIERYLESVLETIMPKLAQWTDAYEIMSSLMEEKNDKIALSVALRILHILLRAKEIIDNLYGAVHSNNLNDSASTYEMKVEYYLKYLDKVGQMYELSAIDRPKIHSQLQELRNQIDIFLSQKRYFDDERFKENHKVHCTNFSLSDMLNCYEQVEKQLKLIFPERLMLTENPDSESH